jgi:hypothetical protein
MADEKQVNEVAFLKNLNANRAAAKAAAKEKRPDGIMTDASIMQRFGLTEDGASVTVNGNVSKIQLGNAKQDVKRPYFRFAYSITDHSPLTGMGRGTIVSNYHELTEGVSKEGEVYRTVEDAYAQLFYEFQGLGEDTESWDDPVAEAVKSAKLHTKEKTPVSITLSTYAKRDKSKGLGLNIRVNPIASNEDLDDANVEDEDVESEGTEDGEDYTPDANWVGYWVTWEDETGPDNAATVLLESFDEDSATFTGTGDDGTEYTDIPVDQITYIDPQPESEE